MEDYDIINKIQKKYNFNQVKNFNELKKVFPKMLHDKDVPDRMVKAHYDEAKSKSFIYRFQNEDNPYEAKKEITNIIRNEMKSRGLKYK